MALPYEAETRDAERFREWVAAGRAGTMGYLERKAENGELLRERTAVPFPWARSAIVCFASYAFPSAPLSTEEPERGSGWIARYAWTAVSRQDVMPAKRSERRPSDYHKVLLKRLRAVEARLHEEFGEFESRSYVDTGPVVERALAAAAGLGWTGKNTCLIHPKLGSFGFLAVLLTSLEVDPEEKTSGAHSRPLRQLHALHRGLPHERARRALPDGCDALHRVPDHRAQGADRGRASRENGPAGLRLRHLPGCVPVESKGAAKRRRSRWTLEIEPRPELVNPALEWLAEIERGRIRAAIQRIAGAPRRISGTAPKRGHRHGQQRAGRIRAAA